MSELVIKVENLTKEYKLGVISHRTLYRDLQSNLSKLLHKEDPNSKLGSVTVHRSPGGKFKALDDISIEVRRGDVLGIIGKNGAGKSTLLKILSRVTGPTKGEIKIKGKVASLLEVGTGFHQELTGRENIYLNGAILGMRKNEIKSKFDEIVDFSGIEEFIDTPVKRYSSGMYVRLAFAVAAHLDPEILIVDEVLAVGDIEFRKKCLGKMSEVSKSGRTIIFVSHEMNAIRELCNKGMLFEKGKVLFAGDTNSVINKYSENVRTQSSKRHWEPNNKPGDDIVKLNYVRLINSADTECSVFDFSQNIGVEVNYEILRNKSRVNICVAVYSNGGQLIFMTFPPKELIETAKCNHSIICWLPSHLLNIDYYSIRVNAHTFYPTKMHFDIIDALQFEIVQYAKETISTDFQDKISGFLKVTCNWSVVN